MTSFERTLHNRKQIHDNVRPAREPTNLQAAQPSYMKVSVCCGVCLIFKMQSMQSGISNRAASAVATATIG
ncbi:MAG: hypothetical protein ACRD7E_14860 [Bryobacteraceae bacterium]